MPDAEYEWTDRYGGPENWPDLKTMCKGQCEGMGVVPVKGALHDRSGKEALAESAICDDPTLLRLWAVAEATEHAEDGWHFVTCPTCAGSGKRQRRPPAPIDGSGTTDA